MSYSDAEWRTAITNLVKLTSKGNVEWHPTDVEELTHQGMLGGSFECVLADKLYRITKLHEKTYLDDVEYYWEEKFVLEIFKKSFSYLKIGTAPGGLSVMSTLYDAAESSYAYSQGALKDLLD